MRNLRGVFCIEIGLWCSCAKAMPLLFRCGFESIGLYHVELASRTFESFWIDNCTFLDALPQHLPNVEQTTRLPTKNQS